MIDLTKDFMDGIYYDHEEFMDRQAYELGEEAGKLNGIEIGKLEGIKNNQIEIAKKMLLKNEDIAYIAELTNLSLKEIKKISKELFKNK